MLVRAQPALTDRPERRARRPLPPQGNVYAQGISRPGHYQRRTSRERPRYPPLSEAAQNALRNSTGRPPALSTARRSPSPVRSREGSAIYRRPSDSYRRPDPSPSPVLREFNDRYPRNEPSPRLARERSPEYPQRRDRSPPRLDQNSRDYKSRFSQARPRYDDAQNRPERPRSRSLEPTPRNKSPIPSTPSSSRRSPEFRQRSPDYRSGRPNLGLGLATNDKFEYSRKLRRSPSPVNEKGPRFATLAAAPRHPAVAAKPQSPKQEPSESKLAPISPTFIKVPRLVDQEIEEGEDVEMEEIPFEQAMRDPAILAGNPELSKHALFTPPTQPTPQLQPSPVISEKVQGELSLSPESKIIDQKSVALEPVSVQIFAVSPPPRQPSPSPKRPSSPPALLPPVEIETMADKESPVLRLSASPVITAAQNASLQPIGATPTEKKEEEMHLPNPDDSLSTLKLTSPVEHSFSIAREDAEDVDMIEPMAEKDDFEMMLKNVTENAPAFTLDGQLLDQTQDRTTLERRPFADITNVTPQNFLAVHECMMPFLLQQFQKQKQEEDAHTVALQKTYKELDRDWKSHVQIMEKIKARNTLTNIPGITCLNASQGLFGLGPPGTPSNDNPGFSFMDDHGTPFQGSTSLNGLTTPGPVSSRASRRGMQGDAVRSEAHMQEIMAYLETVEALDPATRAARTAAVVPPMLDSSSTERAVACFRDSNALVRDPEEFYGFTPVSVIRADPAAVEWSDDEVQIFCRRFGQYPKQFGKIASYLADKNAAQCVLFYYRSKKIINYKSFADRRVGGRRRRAKLSKGSSLLADLQPSRKEPEAEEANSPPQSPEATFGFRSIRADPINDDLLGMGQIVIARMQSGATRRSEADAVKVRKASKWIENNEDEYMEQDDSASDRETEEAPVETTKEKSKGRKKPPHTSFWSTSEKQEFLRLLPIHGKAWEEFNIQNKTAVQCRNYYTNNRTKLSLEKMLPNYTEVEDEAMLSDQETVDLHPQIHQTESDFEPEQAQAPAVVPSSARKDEVIQQTRAPSGMHFLLNAAQEPAPHDDWFTSPKQPPQRSPRRSSAAVDQNQSPARLPEQDSQYPSPVRGHFPPYRPQDPYLRDYPQSRDLQPSFRDYYNEHVQSPAHHRHDRWAQPSAYDYYAPQPHPSDYRYQPDPYWQRPADPYARERKEFEYPAYQRPPPDPRYWPR